MVESDSKMGIWDFGVWEPHRGSRPSHGRGGRSWPLVVSPIPMCPRPATPPLSFSTPHESLALLSSNRHLIGSWTEARASPDEHTKVIVSVDILGSTPGLGHDEVPFGRHLGFRDRWYRASSCCFPFPHAVAVLWDRACPVRRRLSVMELNPSCLLEANRQPTAVEAAYHDSRRTPVAALACLQVGLVFARSGHS